MNVIFVIKTVVHKVLAKGFRSAAFNSVVEDTVHKFVPKPPSIDAAAVTFVDVSSFTVLVAKFVK